MLIALDWAAQWLLQLALAVFLFLSFLLPPLLALALLLPLPLFLFLSFFSSLTDHLLLRMFPSFKHPMLDANFSFSSSLMDSSIARSYSRGNWAVCVLWPTLSDGAIEKWRKAERSEAEQRKIVSRRKSEARKNTKCASGRSKESATNL